MASRVRPWLIASAGGLLASGGCDDSPQKPAHEIVEQILTRAFGEPGKRRPFRNVLLELRARPLDEDATTVILGEGGKLRIDAADENVDCIAFDGERGARWRRGAPSEPLDAAGIARARRQGTLLRAMLLAPLRTAAKPRGETATRIRLDDDWALEHDGPVPTRLTSETYGDVRFFEVAEPPALALPRVVEIDGIGIRHVRVRDADVEFAAGSFAAPGTIRANPIEIGSTAKPTEPEFQRPTSARWFVIEDPGTWKDRVAACQSCGEKLGAQEQGNGGDPFLFREGKTARMVVPFRPAGERRYEPAEGDDVRPGDSLVAAVVYAPAGRPFDERVAAGQAALSEYLRSHGRRAGGPLRIVVNMYFEPDLGDDPTVERTMDVRLELPVAE